MRIPEEYRNMVLLTAVTLLSVIALAGVSLVDAPARSAEPKPIYLADQTPVRVVGTPFVPNANPRER